MTTEQLTQICEAADTCPVAVTRTLLGLPTKPRVRDRVLKALAALRASGFVLQTPDIFNAR